MNTIGPVDSTNSALNKPQTNLPGGTVEGQNNAPSFRPPFIATRRDLINQFRSKKLVEEMIEAGWIKTIRYGKSGRESLFDYESARHAYVRLKAGEVPQVQPEGGQHA